ncbi:MAG: 2-amino-4-hydroxy-6-hydroxymethyldihydropteridine diphosphokinase [Rubrobacter sp.]|nr:2-amino-4-hydroxy-6-hydroxymethyldihydropteridine diphosphokinase [Rubrobacter sp.]
MTRAFLSLGSNLGDRTGYLRASASALDRGDFLTVRAASPVYETAPVEVEGSQPEYLNCVVEVECEASMVELLRFCQGIEAALGREEKGERRPRTADLDLLLFGEEVAERWDLRVPHPGVLRVFNLRSLADLDSGLYIPGMGGVGELLSRVPEEEFAGVRESGSPGEVWSRC